MKFILIALTLPMLVLSYLPFVKLSSFRHALTSLNTKKGADNGDSWVDTVIG